MNTREAAEFAVFYLSRLIPRGQQEEQELLHVIQALSSLANGSTNVYNDRSVSSAA